MENQIDVTVLMPVFNAERYLDEAIKSILSQTFDTLELLLINDGSTDDSETIIRSFNDPRIVYIKNDTNKGLIFTLNKGIDIARGRYIARMDADDKALPDRLKEQFDFLETNSAISLCGTWYQKTNTSNIIKPPTNVGKIRTNLLIEPVLAHPTVMFRKSDLLKCGLSYNKDYLHAEDYKLWSDCLKAGLGIGIVPKLLLLYRVHEEQVSSTGNKIQIEHSDKIKLENGCYFFGDIIAKNERIYLKLLAGECTNYTEYKMQKELIDEILSLNISKADLFSGELSLFFNKLLQKIIGRKRREKKWSSLIIFNALFFFRKISHIFLGR